VTVDDSNNTVLKDNIQLGVPCSSLEKEGFFNYPALASNYAAIKEKVDSHGICFGIQDPSKVYITGWDNSIGDRKVMIRVGTCFGRSDCEWPNFFNFEINVFFPQFSTLLYDYNKPYDVTINLDDPNRFFAWRSYTTHTIKTQLRAVNQAPRMVGVEKEIARYPHILETKDFFFSRYSGSNSLIISSCMGDDEMHMEVCQGFVKYDYRFAPLLTRYTRTYTKITDLFSNIGGFASILFQVFSYLNLAYIYFAQKSIMIKKAFPLLQYLDKNRGEEYIKYIEQAAGEVV
jgi:hypothetical protein